MFYNIRCDNSLKVRIAAFQAVGPGSIPGCRKQKFFLNAKTETKKDNRGIKLIKEFLLTMRNSVL